MYCDKQVSVSDQMGIQRAFSKTNRHTAATYSSPNQVSHAARIALVVLIVMTVVIPTVIIVSASLTAINVKSQESPRLLITVIRLCGVDEFAGVVGR